MTQLPVETTDPQPQRPVTPNERRLVGEDTPFWLAAALALLGTILALAATALVLPWAEEMLASQFSSPEPHGAESVQQQPASDEPPLEPLLVPLLPGQSEEDEASRPSENSIAPEPPKSGACAPIFNVPFALGSARPNIVGLESSAQVLRNWLAQNAAVSLVVEGRTDVTGPEQFNIGLSFMRAKAVERWLADLGVPLRRMVIRAAGPTAPGASSGVETDDQRVVLRVEGLPGCH